FYSQAEAGIRDFHVTGVQSCALPIWAGHLRDARRRARLPHVGLTLGPANGGAPPRPRPLARAHSPTRLSSPFPLTAPPSRSHPHLHLALPDRASPFLLTHTPSPRPFRSPLARYLRGSLIGRGEASAWKEVRRAGDSTCAVATTALSATSALSATTALWATSALWATPALSAGPWTGVDRGRVEPPLCERHGSASITTTGSRRPQEDLDGAGPRRTERDEPLRRDRPPPGRRNDGHEKDQDHGRDRRTDVGGAGARRVRRR